MNINDKQDFYNEVETDDINAIIEPVADDDMPSGMDVDVHVIGGEVAGEDAMTGIAPDAYVMDVDSEGVFDFGIANEGSDGLIDDVEILDLDPLDGFASDDAIVVDVDSDGDFDYAVAEVNDDGIIDADEVLDSLDESSSESQEEIIDLEEITEDAAPVDEPALEEEQALDSSEEFYLDDDNNLDVMTDDIIDL